MTTEHGIIVFVDAFFDEVRWLMLKLLIGSEVEARFFGTGISGLADPAMENEETQRTSMLL